MIKVWTLLFIFCLPFLAGCRLDGETLVEGQVMDFHTDDPVPFAWVAIYGDDPKAHNSSWCWACGGSTAKFITERQTNAYGEFGFQFDSDLDKPFEIIAGMKQGQYAAGYTEPLEIKKRQNNKNLKVKFRRPWPVTIHIKDTGPPTSASIIISYDWINPLHTTYVNVKDTVLYTTVWPYTNPYMFSYTITYYDTGFYDWVKRDIYFPPVNDDTVRIELEY